MQSRGEERSGRRDETGSPARGKVRGLTVGGLGPVLSCPVFYPLSSSSTPSPFRPLLASTTEGAVPAMRNRISFGRAVRGISRSVGSFYSPFVTASLSTLCETTLPAILSRIDEQHDRHEPSTTKPRIYCDARLRIFRGEYQVDVFDHAFVSPKNARICGDRCFYIC